MTAVKRRGTEVRRPRGEISPTLVLALTSLGILAIVAGLIVRLRVPHPELPRRPEIRVYCAAAVAQPVELALAEYRRRYDIDAEVTRAGGSGKLLGQIVMEAETNLPRGADLYISADKQLIERGRQRELIAEQWPMASQRAVIAVPVNAGHPQQAPRTLAEMIDDTKFGIANSNAAIGQVARSLAAESQLLEPMNRRCAFEAENVMQLAQALKTGALEAAIVWDTTVIQINRHADESVLRVAAELKGTPDSQLGVISVGIVSRTPLPGEALRLVRFLTDTDGGLPFLEQFGFEVIEPDRASPPIDEVSQSARADENRWGPLLTPQLSR